MGFTFPLLRRAPLSRVPDVLTDPAGDLLFPDPSAAFDVVDQPFCSETLFLGSSVPSYNTDTAPQSPFGILQFFWISNVQIP